MPPWPGMDSPKSLMLKVRFRPDAKKPPKGAISDANVAKTRMWNWMGANVTVRRKEGNGAGRWYVCGLKTGFGVHSRPVQMLAPRS